MVAMATTLFTVYCKLFHMMPYIIILKVRKFHQPTASRFSTARKKPVGRGHIVPPSLNRVKTGSQLEKTALVENILLVILADLPKGRLTFVCVGKHKISPYFDSEASILHHNLSCQLKKVGAIYD